jgi:hypothetical protein
MASNPKDSTTELDTEVAWLEGNFSPGDAAYITRLAKATEVLHAAAQSPTANHQVAVALHARMVALVCRSQTGNVDTTNLDNLETEIKWLQANVMTADPEIVAEHIQRGDKLLKAVDKDNNTSILRLGLLKAHFFSILDNWIGRLCQNPALVIYAAEFRANNQ